MNLIAPLITPDTTLLDMSFTSKKKLFEHAAELFAQAHGLKSTDIFTSLFERERLGSTALGYGIAIPHGRIKGLKDALGAFVRLRTPIDFDAPDGKPVGHVFVLLVPEHATEQHLQLLSELAQMFSERRFREQLASAPDPTKLHALFAQWTPAA